MTMMMEMVVRASQGSAGSMHVEPPDYMRHGDGAWRTRMASGRQLASVDRHVIALI